MVVLVRWVYVVALGVWLGTVVFFSFIGAPAIFRTFGEEQRAEAGRVVGAIFPGYYRIGYVCGAALLVASVILAVKERTGAGAWLASIVLTAVMLGAGSYAGMVIQPRAHQLRLQLHEPEAAPTVQLAFERLHRRAVQLNAVILLGGLVLAGLVAARLPP